MMQHGHYSAILGEGLKGLGLRFSFYDRTVVASLYKHNINLYQLCLQTVRGGRSEGGEGNTYVKGVALKTGVLTFFKV